MTHPDELLAPYVDGSLTPEERAEVDAHLATCGTCREEVALATRSVALLAEVPEEPVPVGVMSPVWEEIGRAGRARRHWVPRIQWVAGAAAAAAAIALAAVVLPQLGGNGTVRPASAPNASPTTVAEGAAGGSPRTVPLEIQKIDYTPAKLVLLAPNRSKQQTASDGGVRTPRTLAASSTPAKAAERCLDRPGGITSSDRLVRLIQAKFQGTPAYIGVYKEGNPPARIVIWVVSKPDCRILSFSSKRL